MTHRSKWFSLAISLSIIFSMMLISLANVRAAGLSRHTTKSKVAAASKRCAKRTKAAGTIKYSDWQFPDTLNGYQSTLLVTSETTASMFSALWRYNNQAHLFPMMLTKMPSIKNGGVTNGGKTITLHLKKGMMWSNGQEITSKDFKFGWQVDSDPLTGPACSGSCDVISKMDTPDKYTVVWHLKQVYAAAIPYAAPDVWPTKWANAWNGSPHAAAQKLAQDQTFNFEGPGFPTNGPYTVTEFVKDDRIVLSPMKYYNIMNCGAYVKNLIFAFYSDKPGMIAAAANKETDVTQDYTIFDIPELQKHVSSYKLYQDPGFTFEHLELNHDATYHGNPNPLANTKVRQAMALALDKLGMIESALSVSKAAAQNVEAATPLVTTKTLVQPFADTKLKGQWDPIAKKYLEPGTAAAVKDAKKLLSQTSYASGFSIDMSTTTGNPVRAAQLQVIASNWKNRLNITSNISYIPAGTFFADWDHGGTIDHGDFQVALFAFSGSPDPDQLKYNLVSTYIDREQTVHNNNVNGNDSAVKNPVIDSAFKKAAGSFDKKVRQKYYNLIQVTINKNADWIPLYFRPNIVTQDGRVTNFTNNPTQATVQWNTFDWKPKTK